MEHDSGHDERQIAERRDDQPEQCRKGLAFIEMPQSGQEQTQEQRHAATPSLPRHVNNDGLLWRNDHRRRDWRTCGFLSRPQIGIE